MLTLSAIKGTLSLIVERTVPLKLFNVLGTMLLVTHRVPISTRVVLLAVIALLTVTPIAVLMVAPLLSLPQYFNTLRSPAL